jgi:hypothetical protein
MTLSSFAELGHITENCEKFVLDILPQTRHVFPFASIRKPLVQSASMRHRFPFPSPMAYASDVSTPLISRTVTGQVLRGHVKNIFDDLS